MIAHAIKKQYNISQGSLPCLRLTAGSLLEELPEYEKRMERQMIQDIAPHRFDNSFRVQKPEVSDYAFYIKDNRTLLIDRGSVFGIPTMGELEAVLPGAQERAVYLFAIDEKPYFLIEDRSDGKENRTEDKLEETTEEKSLAEKSLTEKNLAEKNEDSLGTLFEWKGTQYFRTMEPEFHAFAAITATQLWRWRQSRRFCGRCGGRTEDSMKERARVCPSCGQIEYPKICPAVIVAVTNGDKLLMSRYRSRSYGGYALIAGFVEIGETFEETVRREVMEEVGLRVKNVRYFKSQPWAFTDTEMIGFFAELDGDDTIKLEEEELAEAGWYHRDEIPDDEVLISVGSDMKMAFKYNRF